MVEKGPGIAWAKQDELGEATARVIANHIKSGQSPYINRVILLSSPGEWSLKNSVNALGTASGVSVSIKAVSKHDYAYQPFIVGASGYGSGEAGIQWAIAFDAIKAGEAGVAKPLLKEVLGREPESFDHTVSTMAKA